MRHALCTSLSADFLSSWTSDPILSEYKFCNSYRVLDRTSQFAITAVIEKGSQDPTELLFRILLFNSFNRIGTWKLLEEAFGGKLEYATFDAAQYDEVLAAAVKHGEALFTGAYIKIQLYPIGVAVWSVGRNYL